MGGNLQPVNEKIRTALEASSRIFAELSNRILDENSATSRWIIAQLTTLNAGALLALLSSEKIEISGKIPAGLAFVGGVIFSVVVGYLILLSSERMVRRVGEISELLRNALLSDWVDAKAIDDKIGQLEASHRPWKCWTHATGWLSLALFVVGLVQVGLNLK